MAVLISFWHTPFICPFSRVTVLLYWEHFFCFHHSNIVLLELVDIAQLFLLPNMTNTVNFVATIFAGIMVSLFGFRVSSDIMSSVLIVCQLCIKGDISSFTIDSISIYWVHPRKIHTVKISIPNCDFYKSIIVIFLPVARRKYNNTSCEKYCNFSVERVFVIFSLSVFSQQIDSTECRNEKPDKKKYIEDITS